MLKAAIRASICTVFLWNVVSAQSADRALVNLRTFDAVWTVIHETYFDPNFNGIDWNAVRRDLRPKAEAARTDEELRAIVDDMLTRLGKSHLTRLPREALENRSSGDGTVPSTGDCGLEVRVLDGQVVVARVDPAGPAAGAGVKTGWVLAAVGTEELRPLLQRIPRSGDSRWDALRRWARVTQLIEGPAGSAVQLTFADGRGRITAVEIERRQNVGERVKLGSLPTFFARLESHRLHAGRTAIGVIRFNIWMVPIVRQFDLAIDGLRDADGIVIDLRGNVGGVAAMLAGLSGHFLNERVALGTMETRETQLRFSANPRRVSTAGTRVEPFAGPVAILVDGLTYSASEVFAGGMQSIGRARIFGQQTPGGVLPSAVDRLPNGDMLEHPIGEFVTATGQHLEGRGVTPDEIVPLTRGDLLAGRDAPLDAAVRWISRGSSGKNEPR
jgi:carboxyl-terminal processing protease